MHTWMQSALTWTMHSQLIQTSKNQIQTILITKEIQVPQAKVSTESAEEESTASEVEEEIEEVLAEPVHTPAEADDKASRLEALISDLRREQSRDRKQRDDLIGQLQGQIEELQDWVLEMKKRFEKASRRPPQTMVTPPPPPPEDKLDEPLPAGSKPAHKSGFFANVW
jgi:hypothetical protein